MNNYLTAIAIVLDQSGSMGRLRSDTIGSFNTFLQDQKNQPGEALFTLCSFNDDLTFVHDFVKLQSVSDLTVETYSPHGSTALLDAMGITIDKLGQQLSALPEEERPGKVIVVVITDGQENHSTKYDHAKVKSMIELQQNTYSWQFLFFGADQNQIEGAVNMGITRSTTHTYDLTKSGTKRLYSVASANVSSFRNSK